MLALPSEEVLALYTLTEQARNPQTGKVESAINLQATLSAGSADSNLYVPHHPITCASTIRLHDDESMECEHVRTPSQDPRTHQCVNASVAMLLLELAFEL